MVLNAQACSMGDRRHITCQLIVTCRMIIWELLIETVAGQSGRNNPVSGDMGEVMGRCYESALTWLPPSSWHFPVFPFGNHCMHSMISGACGAGNNHTGIDHIRKAVCKASFSARGAGRWRASFYWLYYSESLFDCCRLFVCE